MGIGDDLRCPAYALTLIITAMIALTSISGEIPETDDNEDLKMERSDRLEEYTVSTSDHFTENLGQWDSSICFMSDTKFGHIGLSEEGLIMNVLGQGSELGHVLRYDFMNPNSVIPTGMVRMNMFENYYYGRDSKNWAEGVGCFRTVVYEDLWDGVDMEVRNTDGHVKYQFIADPGSDLDDIAIEIKGADDIHMSNGDIIIDLTGDLFLREEKPLTFYTNDPTNVIESNYNLRGNILHFEFSRYELKERITVDPLIYATYLGGTDTDRGNDNAIDSSGNHYLTGETKSDDFPTTPGVYNRSIMKKSDIYVTKLNQTAGSLVYSTYIGGNESYVEYSFGISVDSSGNAYVVGQTDGTDYPTTKGAYKETGSGIFVTKLDSKGGKLLYSTMIGSGENRGDITIDSEGNAYVCGSTMSSTFPTTSGSYDETFNGGVNIVVFKLDSSGSSLLYSTFVGDDCRSQGIEIDEKGCAYVTGNTWSSTFPVTSGVYDTTINGGNDVLVFKLNETGGSLVFSTFVGGSTHDYGCDLVVDSQKNIYVAGDTWSSNFPTTSNAYDTTQNGIHMDGFIFKLDSSAANMIFSTYLGGTGTTGDVCNGIDIDSNCNVYVTGQTDSSDFPKTKGAYDTTPGGGIDGFISVLSANGKELAYSTYFGGSGNDIGNNIIHNGVSDVYVCGDLYSSDFVASKNAYDTSHNGGMDAVALKLRVDVKFPPSPPRNPSAILQRGWVNVNWTTPDYDGGDPILGYKVYRGGDGIEKMIKSCGTDVHEYNDTDVMIGSEYWYRIVSFNVNGDSEPSVKAHARDMYKPAFGEDLSARRAIPGENYTFRINVFDNQLVKDVHCLYWYGTSIEKNISLKSIEENIWTDTIQLPDSLETLNYRFLAEDNSSNWAVSEPHQRVLSGEIRPVFIDDQTPAYGTTGDPLIIRVSVIDNVWVKRVSTQYWFRPDRKNNESMVKIGGDIWELEIMIPPSQEEPLSYVSYAEDLKGNFNLSELKQIPIIDNDPPVLSSDLTNDPAFTGETHRFGLIVDDNIGLSEVQLNYRIDDGDFSVEDMSYEGTSTFSVDLDIPNSGAFLEYFYFASDLEGNNVTGELSSISIQDLEYPVVSEYLTENSAQCGSEFYLKARIIDNIAVERACAEYYFGEGDQIQAPMKAKNGVFSHMIYIPLDSVLPLYYRVRAWDITGNEMVGDLQSVEVLDGVKPWISPMDDISVLQGRQFTISAKYGDNIGIASVSWEGSPINGEGAKLSGSIEEAGVYDIKGKVIDKGGNENSASFSLEGLPSTEDSDSDGMTDQFELRYGLDPNDPSDSTMDPDGDGLTNIMEMELETDPSNDDTDGDGMDDGWEVKYGLDPLVSGFEDDSDSDGISDLEEYRKGTDPTKRDDQGNGDKILLIYLAAVSVALLVLLIILTAVLVRRKRPPTKEKNVGDVIGEGGVHKSEVSLSQEFSTYDPVVGNFSGFIDKSGDIDNLFNNDSYRTENRFEDLTLGGVYR